MRSALYTAGNLKVMDWTMFKDPDLLPCTSYALELSVMIDLPEGFTMVLNLKGGGGDV